ncbi:aminotransferase class V-fold PLP-dependent enzyme [Streptomyces sp. NPDC001941]|uniref:aminotransferase class V-fold PLP-dependent enzyme n=1 Tax=Streptomyces sp. NPDC001941 TaxID=3154659 RepID=UPI003323E897
MPQDSLTRSADDTGPCTVDGLRAAEFPYLDATGQAYLDYTGAALPPLSLVRGHAERLGGGAFGNPHSASPTSMASTRLVEEARQAVLAFCGAPPDAYTVVFTPNATAAIRLVAEAFPFAADRPLVLLGDDHNSVLGARSYAERAGARTSVVPLDADLTTRTERVTGCLDDAERSAGPGLFCYPAQSNTTGVRHPLDWVSLAHRRGWRTLLDAAAHLPTGRLDLARVPADFVALSWYKITGYPSGVGSLIARHDALAELRRPWFAGGTVRAATSHQNWYIPAPPPEGFEDGTPPFLSLPDVTAAVRWHTRIGHDALHRHTTALTERLLAGLATLRHRDGTPAVRVLGPSGAARRGPTVAFDLLRPDGTRFDERLCQEATAAAGVSVRTGCFCNPGVAEQVNALGPDEVRRALARGNPADVDEYVRLLGSHAQGSVRASVGAATDARDVDRLVDACADLLSRAPADPTAPRTGC